jgi:lipid-A-disaccharide synthase-like uncharacterized protein
MLITIIGIIGMVIILTAFVLNLFKIVTQSTITYCVMNIIGSAFLLYYAIVGDSLPFIVLQIVWIIFSAYKIILIVKKNEKEHHIHAKNIHRDH